MCSSIIRIKSKLLIRADGPATTPIHKLLSAPLIHHYVSATRGHTHSCPRTFAHATPLPGVFCPMPSNTWLVYSHHSKLGSDVTYPTQAGIHLIITLLNLFSQPLSTSLKLSYLCVCVGVYSLFLPAKRVDECLALSPIRTHQGLHPAHTAELTPFPGPTPSSFPAPPPKAMGQALWAR